MKLKNADEANGGKPKELHAPEWWLNELAREMQPAMRYYGGITSVSKILGLEIYTGTEVDTVRVE